MAATRRDDDRTGLVHGDMWHGNTLWDDDGQLTAVLDWDAVAALASPPDMGWFPESMAAQGRPDLTHAVMLERRDAFLAAALSQLKTSG